MFSQRGQKRPPICTFFRKVPHRADKLQCKTCGNWISYRSGNTTKNLRHHMSKYHWNQVPGNSGGMQFAEPRSEASTSSSLLPSTTTRNLGGGKNASRNLPSSSKNLDSSRQGQLDNQLVRMMVKSLQPLSLVENKEFIKFVQLLKPNYSVPSRDALEKLIGHYFETISRKIREDLKTVKCFSVATEKLTSFEDKEFLSVTVYFVDEEECKLKSYFLDCFSIDETVEEEEYKSNYLASIPVIIIGDTDTKNTTDEIEKLLANWDLRDFNNQIFISDFGIPVSTTRVHNKWTCVKPCYTYLLNNMLKEIFDEISPFTEKIEKSAEALQETFNLNFPIDTTTTENTLNLFKKVLESSHFMVFGQYGKLSNTDYTILGKICEILEMFNAIYKDLKDEQYVNISKVLLYSNTLSSHLREFVTGTNDLLDKLQTIFEKQLSDIKRNPIYYESTFLDPRFKEKFRKEDAATFALSCNGIIEQLTKAIPSSSSHGSRFNIILFADLYNRNGENLSSTNRNTEIHQYLQEDVLEPNKDPIVWWKNKKNLYPNLFEIMKKRFCVPATCPSCNLFLFPESEKLQGKKFKLDTENFKQILFLHSNM